MFRHFVFLVILVAWSINNCAGATESRKSTKNDEGDAKGHQKIQARQDKAYHPCPHHAQDNNIYSLIQAQSEGRIVNKPPYNNANHALEAAASNSLAQTVTLNTQIGVSGGGVSVNGGGSVGASLDYQHLPVAGRPPAFNSNGYLPPQLPAPPQQQSQPQLPPLPAPVPQPPPAPHFNPHFHRPNHYETAQGQQHGNQYAPQFTSNRFPGAAQANYNQQHSHQQQNNYNYQPHYQHISNGQNHFGSGAYAGSFSHQTHGQQHFNGNSGGVHPVPSVAHNSIDGQLGHIIQNTFAQASLDPTAEKHIYVHVPPEDLEEKSVQYSQLVQPPPQKHYKIIFIKAPTYNQPNAAQLAAAAAAQQTEEKTLIYVLVKKPEEPTIEELQQIQETAVKHHKPEVYFIKYKTRKEGEDLQNQLLQQGTLPGAPELGVGGIDIRGGGIESHSSVSTSSSYATSAISTPSSHQPNEFYGVPIQ